MGIITYILLCGFPPFYDENQVEEMRKILSGDFEFVEPYFDDVSSFAKDLITKMLVVDPKKRLSAEEVLAHPWFHDENEVYYDYKGTEADRGEENEAKYYRSGSGSGLGTEGPSIGGATMLSVGIVMKEQKRNTTRAKFRAGVDAVIAVQKTQRLVHLKNEAKERFLKQQQAEYDDVLAQAEQQTLKRLREAKSICMDSEEEEEAMEIDNS